MELETFAIDEGSSSDERDEGSGALTRNVLLNDDDDDEANKEALEASGLKDESKRADLNIVSVSLSFFFSLSLSLSVSLSHKCAPPVLSSLSLSSLLVTAAAVYDSSGDGNSVIFFRNEFLSKLNPLIPRVIFQTEHVLCDTSYSEEWLFQIFSLFLLLLLGVFGLRKWGKKRVSGRERERDE